MNLTNRVDYQCGVAPYYQTTQSVRASRKLFGNHLLTRLLRANNQVWTLGAVAGLSCLTWIFIANFKSVGAILASGLVLILLVTSFALFVFEHAVASLAVLTYLAALEPAIRTNAKLPYLILHYGVLLIVPVAALKWRGMFAVTLPLILYVIYSLFEIVGLVLADSPTYARTIAVPSLVITATIFIGTLTKLEESRRFWILNGYLIGALSVVGIMYVNYASGQTIVWSTKSSFGVTAGMSPNQISFLLSVATFICFVLADKSKGVLKVSYWLLTPLLTYMMILTFSRGGLYILTGALVVYFTLQKPNLKSGLVLIVTLLVGAMVFSYAVGKTEGAAAARYSEMHTSNRSELVWLGFQIGLDNPLTGVGTGNYYTVVSDDELFGVETGAHNELARAAAEHGLPGLLVWSLFLAACVFEVLRGSDRDLRALRLVIVLIAFVSMFYNGNKLIAQPLLLLVALASVSSTPRSRRGQVTSVRR